MWGEVASVWDFQKKEKKSYTDANSLLLNLIFWNMLTLYAVNQSDKNKI